MLIVYFALLGGVNIESNNWASLERRTGAGAGARIALDVEDALA